jgi:hypothetical protein
MSSTSSREISFVLAQNRRRRYLSKPAYNSQGKTGNYESYVCNSLASSLKPGSCSAGAGDHHHQIESLRMMMKIRPRRFILVDPKKRLLLTQTYETLGSRRFSIPRTTSIDSSPHRTVQLVILRSHRFLAWLKIISKLQTYRLQFKKWPFSELPGTPNGIVFKINIYRDKLPKESDLLHDLISSHLSTLPCLIDW